MTDPERAFLARRQLGGAFLVALSASVVMGSPAFAADGGSDRHVDDVQREQGDTQDEKDAVDGQIEDLGDDLEDTSAELVAADEKLKDADAAVAQAEENEKDARTELRDAEEEAERIAGELEVAKANEKKIETSLEDIADEQADSKAAVGAIARESYKNGGVGNLALTLDVLSGEGDVVEDMAMARTVLRVQDNAIGRLSTQQAGKVVEQDRLVGVRRDVAALQAEAEANVIRKKKASDDAAETTAELERLLAQQQVDRDDLEAEKDAFERKLDDAQADSDDLEDELALLAQEKHGLKTKEEAAKQRAAQKDARRRADAERRSSGSSSSSSKSSSSSSPAPRRSGGGFLSAPSSGPRTSPFGYRFHPILGTQKLHAGLDYGNACGSPIRAAADGTVIGTPVTRGGGNQIIIDHGVQRGVNLTTIYKHMSRYAVRSGKVERGQTIGYMGSTGLSTGCHLHFETRENGIPVNPTSWL